MGGTLCLPRYGCCIKQQNPNTCKENHTQTPRSKTNGHRRNLSATFNVTSIENHHGGSGVTALTSESDLININTATEEELMTVPGINRITAQNIVEYRRKLGPSGFKKVEDLALVSGVGATKLNQIRFELTVGAKKKPNSTNSSNIDFPATLDSSSRSINKLGGAGSAYNNKVVLNSSNVFQLMKVPSLTQTLAENIVAHRESKGLFRKIDDLVKVRGIKAPHLSAIRPYLLLNAEDEDQQRLEPPVQATLEHGLTNGGINIVCTTPSSVQATLGASQEDLIANYGPLARRSFRTKKKPLVGLRSKQRCLRLASWHLDSCSKSKADNPGVKEVVAMTILENGLDIVAVQHLLDTETLPTFCKELNDPMIPNVQKWSGYHGNWKCVTSSPDLNSNHVGSHLGCLYDSSRGIEVTNFTQIKAPLDGATEALLVQFTTKEGPLAVVNVHCEKTPVGNTTDLSQLLQAVQQALPDEHAILIAGHFNNNSENSVFTTWHEAGYKPSLGPDMYTDISTANLDGSICLDNIWLSLQLTGDSHSESGVVRDGMSNPWIPDGWQWGGLASTHCPLWADVPSR